MRYDKEQIIVDFGLKPFGSQGWMTNKDMECPYCGNSGKWGIIFNDTCIATFHCWKCPRNVSLYEFLKKLSADNQLNNHNLHSHYAADSSNKLFSKVMSECCAYSAELD